MGADIMLGLQEKRVVKHTRDFNEIEKRVIETVLNDSIFKYGINYTKMEKYLLECYKNITRDKIQESLLIEFYKIVPHYHPPNVDPPVPEL